MRTDELAPLLAEIQKRWVYNDIRPNVYASGKRRHGDLPWDALLVYGDFGPVEGHECLVYDSREGCVAEGCEDYRLAAWISHGRVRYLD